MLITLLCILLYGDLNFDGLTLQSLFSWYMVHPIWFILAISELVHVKVSVGCK